MKKKNVAIEIGTNKSSIGFEQTNEIQNSDEKNEDYDTSNFEMPDEGFQYNENEVIEN